MIFHPGQWIQAWRILNNGTTQKTFFNPLFPQAQPGQLSRCGTYWRNQDGGRNEDDNFEKFCLWRGKARCYV
ncbi:MAG: hypothetical protein ABJ375_07565 [Rhizobiaceae bacterium]